MTGLRYFAFWVLLSFLFVTQAVAELNEELFEAVEKGNLALVKQLVSKGANINAKDELLGITPLHLAAEKGNLDIVKYLVTKGANVNTKDDYFSWTPLHIAARDGELEIIKYLISKGSDVNADVISLAKDMGYSEVAKYLESVLRSR